MKKHLWPWTAIAVRPGRVLSENRLNLLLLLLLVYFISPAAVRAANLPPNLGCIGDINVTLDEDCSLLITPGMVLTGDTTNLGEFLITVDGMDTDTLTGCGTHTYTLAIFDNGEEVFSCWGDILAEDKTPPELMCPPNTSEATLAEDMQLLSGIITTEDPTFNPAPYSCFAETDPPLLPGIRNYETHTFSVSLEDIFTFVMTGEFDGLIALYQGEFIPTNPCQNIIARSDQTYNGSIGDFIPVVPAINPSFRLSIPLLAGQSYTLVVSNHLPETGGEYDVAVFADESSRIINLTKTQVLVAAELVCLDIDNVLLNNPVQFSLFSDGQLVLDYNDPFRIPQEIRQLLSYTGMPIVRDNCSQMLAFVYDELEEAGDCGNWTITRHFEFRDRYLSPCEDDPLLSSCVQIITVRKPSLDDVVFPPITTVVECDEGYPTDGSDGGPDDNPHPSLTGYPYLAAAFNFYDLNQSICNIGASYSDEPRVDECPGTYYFRREWTFIDWCDPSNTVIYDQLIRVGDFTGPNITLSIPDYDQDGEPDSRYEYSTAPASCEANIILPIPQIIDGNGCAGIANQSVTITDQLGQEVVQSLGGSLVSLPVGSYQLNYCATDECSNESCTVVSLVVFDGIEPTAACDDHILVSIGGADGSNTGVAILRADQLDEGSSDECGAVSLAIRRDPTGVWLPEIVFDCSDIGQTIEVYLQVTDESNNVNTCWLEIIPEDKILPICTSPSAISITCADWPLQFSGDIGIAYLSDFHATSLAMNALFGAASGTDNCQVDTIVERNPSINLNECGWGTITRRFEAWQARPAGDVNSNGILDANEAFRSTNSCSQLITITEMHDFSIDFPEDSSTDCVAPEIVPIETTAVGCDVLAVNQSDPERFATNGDACYKLGIAYDVINWCLWDGEYTGTEILRRTEDDGETLAADVSVEGNERPVLRYSTATGAVLDRRHQDRAGDSSLPNDDLNDTEGAAYVGDLAAGRWTYVQFITVYDDTPPVIQNIEYLPNGVACTDLLAGVFGSLSADCTGEVNIVFSLADECPGAAADHATEVQLVAAELDLFAIDLNANGQIDAGEFSAEENVLDAVSSEQNYTYTDVLPAIEQAASNIYHSLRLLAEDACGNQTSTYISFRVIDCKAPAPICINGLSATLQLGLEGGCEVAIWASDFIGSPVYDCSGQGPETNETGLPLITQYAIYRASTVVAAGANFTPDPGQTGLVLNANDNETTIVYVYAFDEAGNYDYCETYVQLSANIDCGAGNGSLIGWVRTDDDINIANVNVSISGDMVQSIQTNEQGEYELHNMVLGSDISIAPSLEEDPLNGVTTFDLVLIAKHILGLQPLNSPYRMIAADANNSGSVSTLDMIIIRKLILNLTNDFPNNSSWRFVAADYTFPYPAQPWHEEFPELININNLTGTENLNFKAIKVGDVNGSAN